jgi:histone H3/H4
VWKCLKRRLEALQYYIEQDMEKAVTEESDDNKEVITKQLQDLVSKTSDLTDFESNKNSEQIYQLYHERLQEFDQVLKTIETEYPKMEKYVLDWKEAAMTHEESKNESDYILDPRDIKAICYNLVDNYQTGLKIQREALMILQTALEDYLVDMFDKANMLRQHAKRDEIERSDILILRFLRGEQWKDKEDSTK